jgi:DNA polymerase-3 subunit gamma/tau
MVRMSYLVLARKYRPKTFEQMVGQEHVVQALANALTQSRLHHAYLFTGTRGVGKTTVSRILAKSLNCTALDGRGGITAQPCGACAACTEIDAGRYVDYIELDAASNRSVEEMTQLLDQAIYKPVAGRFKVYMIDEVHMLTGHAFNAMLKTLEEPPEYLKFVLATTDPQKVPVTVLSRCLQFNLRPMAPATVQEHLARVLEQEGIEAEPGALRLLARGARGSMRDALSLTDQAIAYGAGRLQESALRQMLGAVDRSHAVRLVQALAAGDGREMMAAIDALRELGLSAAGTLEEMASLTQQMAVLQVVPDAADIEDPDTPIAQQLAAAMPPDETQLLYSLALHGRAELSLAPDEYAGLAMVLLRFLAFKPQGPEGRAVSSAPKAAPTPMPAAAAAASPVPAGMPKATQRDDGPPPWMDEVPPDEIIAPSREPVAAAAAPAASFERTELGDRWVATVDRLIERGEMSPLARELAMQSQCVAIEGDLWRLRVESESLRSQAERLRIALASLLGSSVRLEVDAGKPADSPARREAAERDRRQREAEQLIHDDPLVRELMSTYNGARIVPGSIKPH